MGALARKVPWIHEGQVGVHPVRGRLMGDRTLTFTDSSRVTLRMGHEDLPKVLALAGQSLDVDGYLIRLGVPQVYMLKPAGSCISRLVVIKGFLEPEGFIEAAKRQLSELGIDAELILVRQRNPDAESAPYIRRTLQVKGANIVGFPAIVTNLGDDASLRLQEQGLGGRRRMGCGLFSPVGTKAV